MAEFKTQGGVDVKINPAPFGEAIALKNAISKEISLSKMDLDLASLSTGDINGLLPLFFQLDSSPAVNLALGQCLGRCTYNSEKITDKTFEAVSAREDYYEVVLACLKENIAPFFKGLLSKLNGMAPKTSPSSTPQS